MSYSILTEDLLGDGIIVGFGFLLIVCQLFGETFACSRAFLGQTLRMLLFTFELLGLESQLG